MIGSQLRDLRSTVNGELTKLRRYDWRAWFAAVTDYVVRGIMAGLSAGELRAILRGDAPTEKPNPRYKAQVKSFILHIRPKYYQRGSTWFTHTWRLGWFSTYFFIVETITGVILMLFYAPTPERAYGDMLLLLSNVPFGEFMRDMHRLGAEGMVAVVLLHMVRVYFTGSYKGERAFTWFTGVILLLVTLLLSFSGYLLPWDQLAYWAVTIGTSMAEAAPAIGTEVNLLLRGAVDIWAGGLMRFYLLHVLLMPLLAIIFISVHYYKVAREHSISLPAPIIEGDMPAAEKKYQEERIDLIPNLIIHELMLVAVATFLMIWACVTFYHAPLEQHADPQITPLHTMAPWYFLWLQGMLKLGDKAWTGIIIPTIIFAILFVVPWLDRNPLRMARNRPIGITMGILAVILTLVLTYMGLPQYGIVTPPAQDILSELVPMTHPGPVRAADWDEIETTEAGEKRTYFVSYPEWMLEDERYADKDKYVFIPALGEEFEDEHFAHNHFLEIMREFKADVESQATLIPPSDRPLAQVTVEYSQPELKRLEFKIQWLEFETDPRTSEVIIDEEGNPVFKTKLDSDEIAVNEQVQVVALHADSEYEH
jgi:quinol-cytochrome oxidoreductase complex cytochrome b subunit